MVRFYMEKGTHKGLYKSIQKTLKFFQTFALLEVSFQQCLFLYHIYLKICLLEQNQSYYAYYLLPIDSFKTRWQGFILCYWHVIFVCLFVCLQIVHCLIGEFFFNLIFMFGRDCIWGSGWLVFLFKELYLLLCLWLGSKWVQESSWCGSLLTV